MYSCRPVCRHKIILTLLIVITAVVLLAIFTAAGTQRSLVEADDSAYMLAPLRSTTFVTSSWRIPPAQIRSNLLPLISALGIGLLLLRFSQWGVHPSHWVAHALMGKRAGPLLSMIYTSDDAQQMEDALRASEAYMRAIVETAVDGIIVIDERGIIGAFNPAAERLFGYSAEEVLGSNVNILMPSPYAEKHNAYIRAYLRTGASKIIGIGREVEGKRKDGTMFPIELAVSEVRLRDCRMFTGIVRDITDRRRAEADRARLFSQTQQRLKELTAIHQAGRRLQQINTLAALRYEMPAILRDLLEYDYSAVLLFDDDAGKLLPFVTNDRRRNHICVDGCKMCVETRSAVFGAGIAGLVGQTGQSVIVNDAQQPPRAIPLWSDSRSVLCVPLYVGDRVVGVVSIEADRPNIYSETDQHVLEILAAQIATAIQNTRLFEDLRASRERLQALSQRLVDLQEAERAAIARELHDEIGQVLTGLKLILDAAARLPASQVASRLDEARTVINELMARVRDLSLDLRPPMLDDMGLLAALQWHFERYTAQTAVQIHWRHNGLERRFSPEIETTIYRVVQEALTNVARHAGVDAVTVQLLADHERFSVRIDDNGRGFDFDAVLASQAAVGLIGMHERVALLGGNLTIESMPGGGTRVIAELPLSH